MYGFLICQNFSDCFLINQRFIIQLPFSVFWLYDLNIIKIFLGSDRTEITHVVRNRKIIKKCINQILLWLQIFVGRKCDLAVLSSFIHDILNFSLFNYFSVIHLVEMRYPLTSFYLNGFYLRHFRRWIILDIKGWLIFKSVYNLLENRGEYLSIVIVWNSHETDG